MQELINPQLQDMAWAALSARLGKVAFVPGGGPPAQAQGGPGGGAPPGQDPSAGAGGPPPGMDPSAGAGGGGSDPTATAQAVAAAIQPMLQGGGGGGGGGMVEPIKPKIDVNVELMQIKKMIAKLCDTLGVQIPASDMAVNSQDLTQMAMGQGAQPAGGAGGQQQSSIAPIQPVGAAGPGMGKTSAVDQLFNNGHPYGELDPAPLGRLGGTAAAIAQIMSRRTA